MQIIDHAFLILKKLFSVLNFPVTKHDGLKRCLETQLRLTGQEILHMVSYTRG